MLLIVRNTHCYSLLLRSQCDCNYNKLTTKFELREMRQCWRLSKLRRLCLMLLASFWLLQAGLMQAELGPAGAAPRLTFSVGAPPVRIETRGFIDGRQATGNQAARP